MKLISQKVFPILFILLCCYACSSEKKNHADSDDLSMLIAFENKGIGPIKHIETKEIDAQLAKRGEGLFLARCISCHKIDQKYMGPALKGISARRSPEWILNMMLNPLEMTQKDSIAKKLLSIYSTQMIIQYLTQDDALAIFEYLRTL